MVVKIDKLVEDSSKVKFYVKSHKYKLGKKTLISVTQLIETLFEKFDTKGIARRLAKFPKYKAEGKGVKAILKEWQESAAHGSRVHKGIEDYIIFNKMPLDLTKEDREKVIQARIFISNFWDKTENKYCRFYPEQLIVSPKYGIAGTIDLLIYNRKTKKIILIDWKTNAKITTTAYNNKCGILESTKDIGDCKLNRYQLQLNLYAYLIKEEYGLECDGLSLVHLKPKHYETYNLDIIEDKVKEILEDYKNET